MKKIFLTNTYDTITYPIRIPSSIGNIYNKINRYRDSIMDYYHKTYGVCNNSNVLVQIIKTLDINPNWEHSEIIQYLSYSIDNVSRTLKLSDSIQVVCLANNTTLVPKAKEVMYIVESKSMVDLLSINTSTFHTRAPVVVTNHPYIDLHGNHPHRIVDANSSQLIVYTIDIVELLIMYKCYYHQEELLGNTSSIASFVHRYVMTNTISSFMDIAIINNYLSKGMITLKNNHVNPDPAMGMWRNRLDTAIRKLDISRSISAVELLKGRLPLPNGTVYDTLRIRGFYENRKSRIYLILTMYQYIAHILTIIDPYASSNSRYTEQLLYDLDVIENNNINSYVDKILTSEYDKTLGMIRSIV